MTGIQNLPESNESCCRIRYSRSLTISSWNCMLRRWLTAHFKKTFRNSGMSHILYRFTGGLRANQGLLQSAYWTLVIVHVPKLADFEKKIGKLGYMDCIWFRIAKNLSLGLQSLKFRLKLVVCRSFMGDNNDNELTLKIDLFFRVRLCWYQSRTLAIILRNRKAESSKIVVSYSLTEMLILLEVLKPEDFYG